jgi:hypothetical protein
VFLRRELNFCVLRVATSGNLDRGLGPRGGGEEWPALYLCVNILLIKFKFVQIKF